MVDEQLGLSWHLGGEESPLATPCTEQGAGPHRITPRGDIWVPRWCIRRGQSLHVPLQFSHKAAPRTMALLAWEPQGEIVQLRCQKSQLFGGTWQGSGHLPQVLIKCSLVTQAHSLQPPSPQSSGHSQRLADICGQMGPCVVSIYPPKGTTAYPAAGKVRWEAAWDSGPLDKHVTPAAPRIPKTHQLRGCLWPEDVWTVGLWGVSPRRREEGEARGHSSAPRPLNHHPSTHPSPASGSKWTCLTAS